MSALVPDVSAQQVTLRPERGFRKRLVVRGLMALLTAGFVSALAATDGGPPVFAFAGLFGLVAAGCAVAYAWQARFATVLTPDGIHVQGYFHHFVPWSDVTAIRVRSLGSDSPSLPDGGAGRDPRGVGPGPYYLKEALALDFEAGGSAETSSVRIMRIRGRRLTLRVPRVTRWQEDSGFYDKIQLIEQWRSRYGTTAGGAG